MADGTKHDEDYEVIVYKESALKGVNGFATEEVVWWHLPEVKFSARQVTNLLTLQREANTIKMNLFVAMIQWKHK